MMFSNTNKAIIGKLVNRSLKANRSGNAIIILAIVLTTWLLTTVFSIGMSTMKSFEAEKMKLIGTTADAAFSNPTSKQLEELKKLSYVEHAGTNKIIGSLVPPEQEANDWQAAMYLYDDVEWKQMRAPLLGMNAERYPEKADEVIIPTWILEHLGIKEPKAGMTLPLTYQRLAGDGELASETMTGTFTLIGWYNDYSQLRMDQPGAILVSPQFAASAEYAGSANSVASVSFHDGNAEQLMDRLKRDLNLEQEQEPYIFAPDDGNSASDWTTMAGIVGLIIFVMFSGYLLIYNMIYISVTTKTKFYGLLKTIGMTRRQVKQMVNGEARRLALIGIVIGLAAGALTSFFIVPLAIGTTAIETGTEISFHPVIFAGSALFAWLTTWAGYRKPARIAGSISPIEASKYERGSTKKGRHGAKVHRMALRNIFRDRKRAFTVLLSLFLGLTTFLTINTLILSMNTDNFIEQYVKDDFQLENDDALWEEDEAKRHKLTDQMVQTIRELEGVKETRAVYLEKAELDYEPAVFSKHVDSFSRMTGSERPTDKQIEEMKLFGSRMIGLDSKSIEQMNAELAEPIDLERFEKGEIALLEGNADDFSLGERFRYQMPGSEEVRELEIGGFAPPHYSVSVMGLAPNVYVSDKVLKEAAKDPALYKLALSVDKKNWPEVGKKLDSLVNGDRELKLTSKWQWAQIMKSAKTVFYIGGGALSFILALIGLLNFVGTMYTSVFVRKRELAVMESIGMTRNQVKQMLLLEGTGYAVISLALISTLGTLISYGAYWLFSQEADYAIYTFPTMPLLITFAVAFLVCLTVPLIAYNKSRKLTVVDRLRESA
ncbi:ABC transporter permease [Paenibacillus sp. NEAU-GSW1]|uniref:ABC transporter permease n=1 Tax=Paenibacillus sp. NEAU-GSW1 TaxID=2682486 RepID=UPI0012E3218D|nr:ABC transporter permease [Paenibacillus sp. NEAU-GSW1]MUT65382.1 FtsX-like permease family protein [Paenibacillus sp. NEAU-GSW1]